MKLNINPKEVLALHNLLRERIAHTGLKDPDKIDNTEINSDDVQLQQLYGRLRAIIVASLTNKGTDLFELWEQGQKAKIAKLEEELDDVKQEGKELAATAVPPSLPTIMSAEDLEVLPDTYPRKGPPPPHMPRPGKRFGHKR